MFSPLCITMPSASAVDFVELPAGELSGLAKGERKTLARALKVLRGDPKLAGLLMKVVQDYFESLD